MPQHSTDTPDSDAPVLSYAAAGPKPLAQPGEWFAWFLITAVTNSLVQFPAGLISYFWIVGRSSQNFSGPGLLGTLMYGFDPSALSISALVVAMLFAAGAHRRVGKFRWICFVAAGRIAHTLLWLSIGLLFGDSLAISAGRLVPIFQLISELLPFLVCVACVAMTMASGANGERTTSARFSTCFYQAATFRNYGGHGSGIFSRTSVIFFVTLLTCAVAALTSLGVISILDHGRTTFGVGTSTLRVEGDPFGTFFGVFYRKNVVISLMLTLLFCFSGVRNRMPIVLWILITFVVTAGVNITLVAMIFAVVESRFAASSYPAISLMVDLVDYATYFVPFFITAALLTIYWRRKLRHFPGDPVGENGFWKTYARAVTFLPLTPATNSPQPAESNRPSA